MEGIRGEIEDAQLAKLISNGRGFIVHVVTIEPGLKVDIAKPVQIGFIRGSRHEIHF
jgi:hypothetical protein